MIIGLLTEEETCPFEMLMVRFLYKEDVDRTLLQKDCYNKKQKLRYSWLYGRYKPKERISLLTNTDGSLLYWKTALGRKDIYKFRPCKTFTQNVAEAIGVAI